MQSKGGMQGTQKIEVDLASQIDKNPTSPFVGFPSILLAREQQATFSQSRNNDVRLFLELLFRIVV